MFRLAPSLLAADYWRLGDLVTEVVQAGAEVLHVDVMDGHFVPNLTMGPSMVKALRPKTEAILDVHLMVTNPEDFIDPFAAAGANWISFHIEAGAHAHRVAQQIRTKGIKTGVAINPGTPIAALESIIEEIDFVLLMSVNPGFGGQSFIERTHARLRQLRRLIQSAENKPFIEVDGGVERGNIAALHRGGVDVAVAGSSVFGADSPAAAVHELISLAEVAHAT